MVSNNGRSGKSSPAQTLKVLAKCHRGHDDAACSLKFDALKELATETSFQPSELKTYHRLLLFLEAFPDNSRLYVLVRSEIARIEDLAQRVERKWGPKTLVDSGMPGTTVEVGLGLSALRWIWKRDPSALHINYSKLGSNDKFQSLLRDLVQSPISDGILSPYYSNKEIYKLSDPAASANWLLSSLLTSGIPDQMAEHCFESFDVWAKWRLGAKKSSLTEARFPARKIVHLTDKSAPVTDLKSHVSRALPKEAELSSAKLRALIDVARTVLFIQGRETDAVNYPSVDDTRLIQLDSGVDVLLLGTIPGRRRFLESFIGFVAAKNRVPCAYGGAWILAGRADIGINIFDWLRGGDSALIFSEVLRAYRQYFAVDLFEVEPYQFGEGNSEGLASGAFWFYWKLGFRSVDPSLSRLAGFERKKFLANRGYKTPPSVIKKLLAAKLKFECGHKRTPLSVQPLGVAALAHVGKKYGGDLLRARRESSLRLKKLLGLRSFKGWSKDERVSFCRLSALIDSLPGLESWPKTDRAQLRDLMKAKGSASERNYILQFSKHKRLISGLRTVARQYE